MQFQDQYSVRRNFLLIKAVLGLILITSVSSEYRLKAEAVPVLDRFSSFTEEDTIRLMDADPSSKEFLAAFKRYFPERYIAMIRTATIAIKRGGGPEQGRRIGLTTVRAFVAENTRNIAFASTPSLVAYAHAQARLFEVMQRDNVTTCAMYAMAEAPQGGSGPNSRAIGDATTAIAIIMMQAAREGMDHPSSRIFQILTDSEQADYSAALMTQFDGKPALLQTAINIAKLQSASKADQCAIGLANAKAIVGLPRELAAKVVAKTLTGT